MKLKRRFWWCSRDGINHNTVALIYPQKLFYADVRVEVRLAPVKRREPEPEVFPFVGRYGKSLEPLPRKRRKKK
jgi:hypothetical protein